MSHARSQRARIAVLAFLAISLAASPVVAATYDVSTTEDGHDGVCDAHCTLREAIIAANADRERDIINLPPGTYRLSIPGRGEDFSAAGDLDIVERIDLRGSGRSTTIIDAAGLDRALHVHLMDWHPGDEAVKLTDLTVTGGEVGSFARGGGILVEGALSLERCTVESSSALGTDAVGGGIANTGTLSLNHVIVHGNSTIGTNGSGGGIWNGHGTLSMVDSVVAGNRTDGYDADGAGLFSGFGTVSLLRVTIRNNDAVGSSSDGGGVFAGYSTFSIVGSTVSGNTAIGHRGGAGLCIGFSTVAILNSTFSGNAATGSGAEAGGIWTDVSTLTVASSTFSDNSIGGDTDHGAIWHGSGTAILSNTLVDGGCALRSHLMSRGGNLESPGNSCGFDRPSDQSNVPPSALGLADLADNGGRTLTHALIAGSAAIDRGLDWSCPGTDQRGEPRPRDGDGDGLPHCDVGAFEAGSEPPGSAGHVYWVPVAAAVDGTGGSRWKTSVAALNRSASSAELELVLRTARGTLSMTASIDGHEQRLFRDVAAELGAIDDKGTLEVRSDRPLLVTSRTFNQSTTGTYGQYMAGMTVDEGLRLGDSATLPQLTQTPEFRTNLGFANMGTDPASVEVTLYDARGIEVGTLEVDLQAGRMRQENEVFLRIAGRNDVEAGSAVVTVTGGTGVAAYASVIDSRTGDAVTMPMWR
jgi:CSLREA domain-containing protein